MIRTLSLLVLGISLLFGFFRKIRHKDINLTNVTRNMDDLEREMCELAVAYFPDPNNQLSKAKFDVIAEHSMDIRIGRGATMLIQAINGNVYVDLSKWESDFAWDTLRAQFILEELRLLIRTEAGRNLGNFEFILVIIIDNAPFPFLEYA